MVFRTLAPPPVPHIMSRLRQPAQVQRERHNPPKWCLVIPGKVVVLIIMMAVYVANYYREKCTLSADGTWVSHDMYLPQSTTYTLANLFFHNLEFAKEPFWKWTPSDS